ncbi:MAG: hypothetical protein FD134_773 [Gallionellaceae bacterium]|nr:MAG: hypothetical protein FD134_773 [Gallionellaceae bacterium]
MEAVNPQYILRNHLAAIARAQQHDYSELERLLQLLRTPFDEQPEMESYALPAPPDTPPVAVSCSS